MDGKEGPLPALTYYESGWQMLVIVPYRWPIAEKRRKEEKCGHGC